MGLVKEEMTRINKLRQRLAEINKPHVQGSVYDEGYNIRSKQKGLSQIDKIDDYKELGHSPAYNEEFLSEMGDLAPSRVEGSGQPKGKGWLSELSTQLRMKHRDDIGEHPSGQSIPYDIFKDDDLGMTSANMLHSDLSKKQGWHKFFEKHRLGLSDDPNIATISLENAKRWAKLKTRLARIYES